MTTEPVVDLCFRLTGSAVPVDHGYSLYASLSRVVPALHQAAWLGIHPLTGLRVGSELKLSPASRLRLRLPADRIHDVLALAGKRIEIDGVGLRIGIPEVHPLRAAANLRARLVNIKGFQEEEPFQQGAQRQLDALGIRGKLGLGRRRVIRIKDKTIVGFQVLVAELTAEESLTLQEHGIGGRRRMGCGIFVPLRR